MRENTRLKGCLVVLPPLFPTMEALARSVGIEASQSTSISIGFPALNLIFFEATDLTALAAEMPFVLFDLILACRGSREFDRFRAGDVVLAIFEIECFYGRRQKVVGSANLVLTT